MIHPHIWHRIIVGCNSIRPVCDQLWACCRPILYKRQGWRALSACKSICMPLSSNRAPSED